MTSQNETTPGALACTEGQNNLSKPNDTPSRKPTSRSARWKDLERTAARKLGGKRVIREHMFERAPDFLIPDFGIVGDAKAHAKFRHHALLDTVARKYCKPGEVAALVTKTDRQIGEYVTLSLDALAALLDEIRASRKLINAAIQQAEGELLLLLLQEKFSIGKARDASR